MSKKNSKWKLITLVAMIFMLCLPTIPAKTALASTTQPKREMRAVWISTVQNIDMKAGMTKEQYTVWTRQTLDKLKANKLNTVIYQVRPTNDAMYASDLAPWSSYITGKKQGTNPGYDPLTIMVEEAHKRGMELHAWMNPYRVTMPGQKLTDLAADNVARTNPTGLLNMASSII